MRCGKKLLRRCLIAGALCWLGFAASPAARAQGITTGSITGTVVDPRGAVIPGATITAMETHTGAQRSTLSQGDGAFWFGAVPIGTYTLTLTSPGFLPLHLSDVHVATGSAVALGAQKLSVGTTASTVTVRENNMVDLDSTDSQVSTTFSSQALVDLPFAGALDGVALLIPGVARTLDDNKSNTNGPNFSANGQRGRSINFEMDGQSNNDNDISGPQIYFDNQDALAEIQVITDNFSAQYGRNMGAVVNYVTKSGTNTFHGSAFEFYTGSWLSSFENQDKSPLFGFCLPDQTPAANNCLTPRRPRFTDHRFGGTLGGPILKNKLWFFGSSYWERASTGALPASSDGATTPTPLGLQQLAAAFPGNPAVSVLANNGPFGIKVGNPIVIPGTLTTETVTSPSGPVDIQEAEFQRSVPKPFSDQEQLGRLDWQPTQMDRFYLRYFYQKDQTSDVPAPSTAEGQFINIPDINHSVGSDWTHTFTPNFVDQLRYSFQQDKLAFEGGSNPNCTGTNLTACSSELVFTGGTYDSGLGLSAVDPQRRTVKTTQVQNNATWVIRNHSIAFGGEWDFQNSPNVYLPGYNGVFLYSDMNALLHDSTGTGLVEMANGNPVIPYTEADAALYAQDNWKVIPNLTLNLGMRWEYFGQAINELHTLSLAQQTGAHPFWDTSLPLSVTTAPPVPNHWKNFEPRVGFAWNPSRMHQRVVLRGGFAINYDPAFYNIFLNESTSSPVANLNTFSCNGGPCLPANGSFSGSAARNADLQYLPTGGNPAFNDQSNVSPEFLNPYTQTYSLGVEYQATPDLLVSVRYVGNHTVHNFQSVDANPDLQSVSALFPNVVSPSSLCADSTQPGYGRPSCANGNVNQVTNGAFSIYNGWQTSITTRNLHGVTADFAYTYSRTTDNVSEIFSNGAGGTTIAYAQNPLNTSSAERGTSGNSFPNVASLSLTYDLPFYERQQNWKGRLFGGYSFHAIYTYNSGQPYNPYQPLSFYNGVTQTYESSLCDGSFNTAFLREDTCRMVLSNPRAPLNTVAYNAGPGNGYVVPNTTTPIDPNSAHWIVNNANEAVALNNPYPGSGRNILRGPSFYNIDANLLKTLKLSERFALQLQLNAYNVFNHDYLGTPIASVAAYSSAAPVNPFLSNKYNSSYGNSLGSEQSLPGGLPGNRVFQLGGKVLF